MAAILFLRLLLLLDVASALVLTPHRHAVGHVVAAHLQQQQQQQQQRRTTTIVAREILKIETTEDYHAMVEKATAEDKLIVIKFYASWCRACKAMAPKFVRIAEDQPDFEFYEVLFDNNKKLCKSLGIKILPYMEIIAGKRGKIDGFTCGPSKISLLLSKLEDISAQTMDVEPLEGTDITALLPDETRDETSGA